MSTRLVELAQRRERLQQRCELQRQQVSAWAQHIEARLSGWDRGLNFLSFFTRRPAIVAAGIAGVFMFGLKRMLGWLGQGSLVIGLARKLAGFAAKL